MDLSKLLADVTSAVSLAKLAVSAGVDAAPFINDAYLIATKQKTLTPADRQAMTAKETELRANIDAVIAADDAATD